MTMSTDTDNDGTPDECDSMMTMMVSMKMTPHRCQCLQPILMKAPDGVGDGDVCPGVTIRNRLILMEMAKGRM